ncbi:MAG: DUF3795 domain-containing protein [Clostridiaceae bacterium]|nr:DUF3795 domain-containing protein [Clostridiaceae bacterium]
MKDFNRENLHFSLCGLNCGLCPMRIDGYCPGCGGGVGNQSCAIARCSIEHGRVEYCYLCTEFPCERYAGVDEFDSFITHAHQLKDIEKARQIGIEAYNEEQRLKLVLLRDLLSRYNDGRRKTFYCVAVNLLPIQDAREAFDRVVAKRGFNQLSLQEQADRIGTAFEEIAEAKNLRLKLRKMSRSISE